MVSSLTLNGLQMDGIETSLQEAEVERVAYVENSSVIEQLAL